MKIEGPKFSPHGTDVAVLSMGGVAVDRADGSGQLLQWGLRGMHIRRLAFSPDETRLAMAVLDGEVVLCDLTEKTEWEVIGRTTGDVNSLEFSPEGQRLFAAFRAEGVWCVPIDGEAGDLQIPGHARVVSLAKFSPDAGRTVTASEDGTARLWPSPPASSLQDLLWRGSSPCLKPGPRSYLFGETKDEAAAKLAACQARVAEHAALGAYQ